MMNRDLKALIRRTAEQEMPDVLEKINLDAIDVASPAVPKRRLSLHLDRIVSFAVVVLVVGFTSLFVYDSLTPGSNPDPLVFDTEESLVGFPIVSAASFLGSLETTPLSLVPLALDMDMMEPEISDQMEDLATYLDIMESVVGDSETISFTPVASDRVEYEYRLVYSAVDLLGNPIEYEIYYNKELHSEGSDQTDLSGLLLQAGEEYQLSGTITENADGIKTRFQATNEAGNYVIVEDKSTDDMQKFDYQLYENAVLVKSHSLRLVLSDAKIEAFIEYVDGDKQVLYRFQKTVNDDQEEIIRIRYSCRSMMGSMDLEDGDIDVKIELNPLTQTYEYKYAVSTNHGNQSSHHEYTGHRSEKSEKDDDTDTEDPENNHPGNDEPGTDDPGNDNPGNDNPGNDNPGNDNPGNGMPDGDMPGHSGSIDLLMPVASEPSLLSL